MTHETHDDPNGIKLLVNIDLRKGPRREQERTNGVSNNRIVVLKKVIDGICLENSKIMVWSDPKNGGLMSFGCDICGVLSTLRNPIYTDLKEEDEGADLCLECLTQGIANTRPVSRPGIGMFYNLLTICKWNQLKRRNYEETRNIYADLMISDSLPLQQQQQRPQQKQKQVQNTSLFNKSVLHA